MPWRTTRTGAQSRTRGWLHAAPHQVSSRVAAALRVAPAAQRAQPVARRLLGPLDGRHVRLVGGRNAQHPADHESLVGNSYTMSTADAQLSMFASQTALRSLFTTSYDAVGQASPQRFRDRVCMESIRADAITDKLASA